MNFGFLQRTTNVLLRAVKKKQLKDGEAENGEGGKSKALKKTKTRVGLRPWIPRKSEVLLSPSVQQVTEIPDKVPTDNPITVEAVGAVSNVEKQTDSFVRQSTKYWVHPCDLPALVTILAENLTVFVFGGGDNCWSPISSVYLDNEQRHCYTDRLLKDTGARIMRLRTYNDDSSKIYVERKVHHEKWTGEVSSKDRFPVKEDQIIQILRGQKVPVPPKSEELRDEFQAMVRDKQLFPVVRIDYDRIAFQPDDHDRVRVSIDMNMKFLRERASHMEWRTPSDRFLFDDEIEFPYSIVEIKLREPYISHPPKWLEDVEKSSMMHRENKFSKYIHANYAFEYMKGNPLRLRQPVWWDKMVFISPQLAVHSSDFAEQQARKKAEEPVASTALGLLMSFGSYFSFAAAEKRITGKVVKIEPKTLFATERTFLYWFGPAIFVCSFGIAIMANGSTLSGCILVGVGVSLISYALGVYRKRSRAILQKRTAGYMDQWGPVFLSVVSICAFIIALDLRA